MTATPAPKASPKTVSSGPNSSPPYSVQSTRLRRFELVGTNEPMLDKKASAELDITLEQNPGRILFPYAYLDDKYGWLFYDDEESLEAFSKVEDQESWNRLMGLVEGNAKEATKKK